MRLSRTIRINQLAMMACGVNHCFNAGYNSAPPVSHSSFTAPLAMSPQVTGFDWEERRQDTPSSQACLQGNKSHSDLACQPVSKWRVSLVALRVGSGCSCDVRHSPNPCVDARCCADVPCPEEAGLSCDSTGSAFTARARSCLAGLEVTGNSHGSSSFFCCHPLARCLRSRCASLQLR